MRGFAVLGAPGNSRVWLGFCTCLLTLILIGTLVFAPEARAAVKIQEVTSEKGVKAWLVQDDTLPIVTLRFSFVGGSAQEPAGKDGLARLMSGLFDEGAGQLDSERFQQALDEAGAEMSFGASRDNVYGSMRALLETKDKAFDLLRLAINEPRFDEPAVNRVRGQIVASIRSRARDPQYEADRRWLRALYGEHPYSRPAEGTTETLAAVTADDLRAFRKSLFAKDNVTIAVVGDIDAATLSSDLDRLFGDLPAQPTIAGVGTASPKLDQALTYEYPLPETTIRLAYPGVRRSDPQFMAAFLMNHILGGGEFTSRLFKEVRERRGLTYGVDSTLVTYDHAEALVIATSTRPEKAKETLAVIEKVVADMARDGPIQAELDAAKKNLTGAYAIQNLDSSSSIASTLIGLQQEDLGIDYIDRRVGLIAAVTLDDVKAAARRLLGAAPATMTVGPAEPKDVQ